MSQSKLVNKTILTSNMSKGRGGKKIDKIFVHHMAGNLTIETCGSVFKTRSASAHYGIGSDGRVGQYVLEENTAWHCGDFAYNQRSIGIECANSGGASSNWKVADKTIAKLIDLLVDICKRNGIKKLNYTGDLKGNLCMHSWTMATACPGGYLKTKFKYIADQVNKKMSGTTPTPAPKPTPAKEVLYRVRKSWADAKSQVGAYKSLESAKKVADEKKLSVFDEAGKLIYSAVTKPTIQMYRVRKTWKDEKSQVGAYKVLENAKKECDKHIGYSVFDESGKAVYTSKKKEPSTDEYTITYNANGGTGTMAKQTVKKGASVTLNTNTFKRDGYSFVGWADDSGKPVMSGTDVTKFKNVDMKHFQLGKVTHKDKAKITPSKSITLYAVWKGVGRQSAVDWAVLIAKDNNFTYGSDGTKTNKAAHQYGCYWGKGKYAKNANKIALAKGKKWAKGYNGKTWEKTTCCNPFISCAYSHGANHRPDECMHGGMSVSTWTRYNSSKGTFKQVKVTKNSELVAGDILIHGSHVWMYVGGGKIVEATSLGNLEKAWSDNSIRVISGTKLSSAKAVIRYYPK